MLTFPPAQLFPWESPHWGASLPPPALGGLFGASPGTEHLHGARVVLPASGGGI